MRELVADAGLELLGVLGSALGAVVFTALGVLAEHAGVQNLLAGQTTLGVWEVGVGILLAFVGLYLLGYQEFVPRLAALRDVV